MYIEELYELCKDKDEIVYANIEGNKRNLSQRYYVEDNCVYLYVDDSQITKAEDIAYRIECEAEDDCWSSKGLFERNTYGDCEVFIIDGYDIEDEEAVIYKISGIEIGDDIIIEAVF